MNIKPVHYICHTCYSRYTLDQVLVFVPQHRPLQNDFAGRLDAGMDRMRMADGPPDRASDALDQNLIVGLCPPPPGRNSGVNSMCPVPRIPFSLIELSRKTMPPGNDFVPRD